MTTSTLKIIALGSVALAAIAVPVSANHTDLNLRGMFTGQQANQGQYISQNVTCNSPCGWQQQRLQKRVQSYAQPTYVTGQTGNYGLRGYSQAGAMRSAQAPHAAISLHGANAHTHAQNNQLAQLGYGQSHGSYYDPAAAAAFYNDRSFNVGGASVRTSVANSARMLDWQENTTGKALSLLANRANGVLAPNSLYLGGAIKGGFMYQKTSDDGLFPILSRFPFFSGRGDDEAGVFAINNAALSFTSTFGDWTTVYLQPEYSETDFARDQDEMQLRKAFVVFGNLEKSPFYAAFGRKTIDFGNFDGYNAFTQTEAQHYFWAMSDQPVAELGFYKNGWKFVASAMSGGRQLRTANAGENNNIGNYAFSAEKEFLLDGLGVRGGAFTLGGGYLHDTIYRDNATAHTFGALARAGEPSIQYRNSAVNAYAEYTSPFFDAMLEYTTTLEPWAGAIPQNRAGVVEPQYLDADGNITFDQNLEVLVAQARIKPMVGGRRMAIAAVGTWGKIGDDFVGTGIAGQPTTWEKNQQHVLSVEYPINDFLDIGAEYVYNKGFIPFVAPQLISNDEVEAHAVNVGFKARF